MKKICLKIKISEKIKPLSKKEEYFRFITTLNDGIK